MPPPHLFSGLVAVRFGQASGVTMGVIAGVFAGWWLSGAPRHLAGVHATWPIALGVAVIAILFVCLLMTCTPEWLRLALSGLTIAASLPVTGASSEWTQLALVPGMAALAMVASSPMPSVVAIPLATDIAAIGGMVALGRLPRAGVGEDDLAALSPLLALWLLSHIAGRMRLAGRAAPLVASVMAWTLS